MDGMKIEEKGIVWIVTIGLGGEDKISFKFYGDEMREQDLDYAISEHLSEIANSILSDAQELLMLGRIGEASSLINKAKLVTMVGHRKRIENHGHKMTACPKYD